MQTGTLGQMYVEFVAKGLDKVETDMEKMKKKFIETAQQAEKLRKDIASGEYTQWASRMAKADKAMASATQAARWEQLVVHQGKVGASLELVKEKTEKFTKAAAIAFFSLTGSVMGFVRAGLAGTNEGDLLGKRMQLLSQQIAGIFLPVINDVSQKIQKLVDWFRSLSGAQQQAIAKWAMYGAAALGVLMILPKLIAAAQAANVAMAVITANPMIAGLALVAGGVALIAKQWSEATTWAERYQSIAGGGVISSEMAQNALVKAGAVKAGAWDKPRTDPSPKSSTEDVTAAFKRAQETAIGSMSEPEKAQVDSAKSLKEIIAMMRENKQITPLGGMVQLLGK